MDVNGITLRQFHEAEGVEDWRVVGDGACAFFRTGSFAAGVRLVRAIGELAGLGDHHPDVDIRYTKVTCTLSTHSAGGITQKDLDLAAEIEPLRSIASRRSALPGPMAISSPSRMRSRKLSRGSAT